MKRVAGKAELTTPGNQKRGSLFRSSVLFAAIVAVLIMLLTIQVMPVPNSTKLYRVLVDFGHAPVFAVIAFLSLYISHAARGFVDKYPGKPDYVAAVFTVLVLAALSELAQLSDPGRSASILDVLRDIVGAALCLLLLRGFYLPGTSKTRLRRRSIAATCTVLIAFLIAPVAWTIAAYVNRDVKWPTILSIESRLDWVLLHPFEAEIRQVRRADLLDSNESTSGILIIASRSTESGLTVEDLGARWHEYRTVCADMTNLNNLPIHASIRFGDAPNFFRSKSFQEVDLFVPALSRVTNCNTIVPASRNSPGIRRTHTGYGSLSLTVHASEHARKFIVHRIWLE